MIINLVGSAYFWTDMNVLFKGVENLLKYELAFPMPIGHITPLEIFCSLSIMYMLADIAESYMGWTGSDGDNR